MTSSLVCLCFTSLCLVSPHNTSNIVIIGRIYISYAGNLEGYTFLGLDVSLNRPYLLFSKDHVIAIGVLIVADESCFLRLRSVLIVITAASWSEFVDRDKVS
jgi:hypothetical protein